MKIIGYLTGLVVVIAIAYVSLNKFDICTSQWRAYSDDEKIDAAIRRVMATYPPTLESFRKTGPGAGVVSYRRPERAIPYSDVAEFRRVNPNCCQLVSTGSEGWKPSLYQRLTGNISAIVRVIYLVRYTNSEESQVSVSHRTHIPLSTCNKPQ